MDYLHVGANVNESIGISQSIFDIFGDSKVGYFDLTFVIHEYILWFDITMNLVFDFMDVVKPLKNLSNLIFTL